MSVFNHVEAPPRDPILGLGALVRSDKRENKVDLTVGIYHDEQLHTVTMRCIKEAEKELLNTEKNKAYLPMGGKDDFLKVSRELVFGTDFEAAENGRIASVQSVGGTNALRLGADLLCSQLTKKIFLPAPTWANHPKIFEQAGMELSTYPYYNHETHELDFMRMLDTLSSAPENSVVLLHVCCHNPTGCDPSRDQWKELSSLMLKRKLIPFFDFAYQGFSVSPEEDAWPVRYFAEQGHELFMAHSFSKFFGLYGERVGALHILLRDDQTRHNVAEFVKVIARRDYSTPPRHGASLVAVAMHDDRMKKMWEDELSEMRHRIEEMRLNLVDALSEKFGNDKFGFLKKRHGLFSMIGINEEAVQRLIDEHAIYMTKSGRINLTGLSKENIPTVVDAIVKAVS